MKLRIRDNTIRLRLTQTEVDRIRQNGIVEARTLFPGGHVLTYVLESSPASVTPAAFYTEHTISVRLPEAMVLAWATTEQVGIEYRQVLVDGSELHVLVEKDFACLTHREGDDDVDTFPHPEAGQS